MESPLYGFDILKEKNFYSYYDCDSTWFFNDDPDSTPLNDGRIFYKVFDPVGYSNLVMREYQSGGYDSMFSFELDVENELESSGGFLNLVYKRLEEMAQKKIKDEIYKNLEIQKNENYIKYIIKELSNLIGDVKCLELEEKLLPYKEMIILRLTEFIHFLEQTYLDITYSVTDKKVKKVQWMGTTLQLATLFYELWQGQETKEIVKGEGAVIRKTKSMINVGSKEDLIAFIMDNFIAKNGNDIPYGTLSDYLSKSNDKPKATATRIKFEIPA